MPATYDRLRTLLRRGDLSIRRGAIFDRVPPPLPLAAIQNAARIEGMLIGLCVGDALGHSTEWKHDPASRNQRFGTIVDHVSSGSTAGGRISDDTQLSFWTLERLLARGSLCVDDLAECFTRRREQIVGMGRNTAAALKRHANRLQHGSPAFERCAGDPATEGRGNGALMRYAPLLLPHLRQPQASLWEEVVLAALITHGHAAALSSVVAFAHLLWKVLRQPIGETPPAAWWLDEYVRAATDLEPVPLLLVADEHPLPEMWQGFRGTLCDFVDTRLRAAWRKGISLRDACSLRGFGSRADVLQTVPAALFVLMSHGDSFESAIIAAVNDTKDNDTIASIVGAMLGALHGRRAVRQRWVDGISSHSLSAGDADDRKRVEQLAGQAASYFVAGVKDWPAVGDLPDPSMRLPESPQSDEPWVILPDAVPPLLHQVVHDQNRERGRSPANPTRQMNFLDGSAEEL